MKHVLITPFTKKKATGSFILNNPYLISAASRPLSESEMLIWAKILNLSFADNKSASDLNIDEDEDCIRISLKNEAVESLVIFKDRLPPLPPLFFEILTSLISATINP